MRRSIGFIALGAFILFSLVGEAVYLYTDYLWFREIGYAGVFTKTLWIKVLLGVLSGVLFFVLFYFNIKLAARRREGVVPLQTSNPEVPGFEDLDPLIRRLLLPVALVLGFLAAPQAAMHWESVLLYFNGLPSACRIRCWTRTSASTCSSSRPWTPSTAGSWWRWA